MRAWVWGLWGPSVSSCVVGVLQQGQRTEQATTNRQQQISPSAASPSLVLGTQQRQERLYYLSPPIVRRTHSTGRRVQVLSSLILLYSTCIDPPSSHPFYQLTASYHYVCPCRNALLLLSELQSSRFPRVDCRKRFLICSATFNSSL